MFEVLMGMFNDPMFWMMVVAVMVGYIFVQAIPYIIVVLAYIAAAIVFIVSAVIGFFIGMYKGIKQSIKDAKK